MFSLISGFLKYLFAKPKVNILLVGLDHAGKTTLLEKIKSVYGNLPSIPTEKIQPTIGMNLAKIIHLNTQIIIWDLGGQLKMRNIWERYYNTAHAIIFVVDSSDLARLEEAKFAYEAVCDHNLVSDRLSVIVMANKQDLEGALSLGDIAVQFYSIQSEESNEHNRLFPISALTGQGLDEAIKAVIEVARIRSRLEQIEI